MWYYFNSKGQSVTGVQYDIDGDGVFIFDISGRMFIGVDVEVDGVEYKYLDYGKYIPSDLNEVMDIEEKVTTESPDVKYKGI